MTSPPTEESILLTTKKVLGLEPEHKSFDQDIVVFINAALLQLRQLGVGPSGGFSVKGEEETWEDLLGDSTEFEAAQSYIYARVRMLFDPPATSFAQEALGKVAEEIGWRLFVQADPINESETK